MGAAQVKALTGALIYIHGEDAACLTDEHESLADTHLPGQQAYVAPDGFLEEGMELPLGGLSIHVLHTPGHSRGGVCFVVDGVIFQATRFSATPVGAPICRAATMRRSCIPWSGWRA